MKQFLVRYEYAVEVLVDAADQDEALDIAGGVSIEAVRGPDGNFPAGVSSVSVDYIELSSVSEA